MSTSHYIPLALVTFMVLGCNTIGDTAPDLVAPTTPSFAVTKVPVCHRQGTGEYVRISIAEAAYNRHIAHGDEPAGTGGLDTNCQPQPCPCFSAASVAGEVATWADMIFEDGPYHFGGDFHTIVSPDFSYDRYFFALHSDQSGYSCGTENMWLQDISQSACEACRSILLEYAP
jgi:hypothetical protein